MEHQCFEKLLHIFRPSHVPPDRRKLGDELLNGVYKKCQNRSKALLKNEEITLNLDGWSNIHKEPVVCVAATASNSDAYLIDSVNTGSESHTAENLKVVAEQALNKGINMNSKLLGL